MRALFFVLMLANLVFFAWHAGYLEPLVERVGEGDRLSQQIAPEKIRVITLDEARQIASGLPRPLACVDWGSFPAQELERALVLLATMNPPPKFTQRKLEETAGWWVYLPSQGSKANADKKVAELKQLGISEFFVVNDDGASKFAISLGVFKSEDAARNYLDVVTRRGVQTAQVDERETRVAKTVLQFREVDPPLRIKLNELKRDFVGLDMKDCPAEDRKPAEPGPDEKKT